MINSQVRRGVFCMLLIALAYTAHGNPAEPEEEGDSRRDSRNANALLAAEPKLVVEPDAFWTLVNPDCSHCIDEAKRRATELRGDDRVLAWTRGKYQGGGIPHRFFLVPYRVISDTYGVFVYDPDAGFTRGFAPSLDFKFHGWRSGVMVIRHKDGTLYSALSGRAFDGPRKGDRLKPVATLVTDWNYWSNAWPGSVAYRMFEKYQPISMPDKAQDGSLASRGGVDARLDAEVLVLGVEIAGQTRAYPIGQLEQANRIIRDRVGDTDLVVLWYGPSRTAAAYVPQLDGEAGAAPEEVRLKFDPAVEAAPFLDKNSGSRFGIEGRAVDGPLKDRALQWVDAVQCRWFAWSAEFPDTGIYGR